jgi:predicted amino acid-binding ACT domain protein
MKNSLVVLLAATLAFSGIALAESTSSDAALEMTMLMQFAEEVGLGDYELIDVLAGYREYRSMMDGYTKQRDEKEAALNAAIANNESGVIAGLTRELMDVDMNIMRLQQSSVNQASALMDATSVAKLYLMVRDMDAAKEAFLKTLAGPPAIDPCTGVVAPEQAEIAETAPAEAAPVAAAPVEAAPVAAAPVEAAPVAAAPVETAPVAAENTTEVLMNQAKEFLGKVAAKDLDGAMVAVSDNFEHYEYGIK